MCQPRQTKMAVLSSAGSRAEQLKPSASHPAWGNTSCSILGYRRTWNPKGAMSERTLKPLNSCSLHTGVVHWRFPKPSRGWTRGVVKTEPWTLGPPRPYLVQEAPRMSARPKPQAAEHRAAACATNPCGVSEDKPAGNGRSTL